MCQDTAWDAGAHTHDRAAGTKLANGRPPPLALVLWRGLAGALGICHASPTRASSTSKRRGHGGRTRGACCSWHHGQQHQTRNPEWRPARTWAKRASPIGKGWAAARAHNQGHWGQQTRRRTCTRSAPLPPTTSTPPKLPTVMVARHALLAAGSGQHFLQVGVDGATVILTGI